VNQGSIPGTLPTVRPAPCWDPSLWVQWLGIENDHTSPPTPEVKKVWSYTSTPPYIFVLWFWLKHKDTHFLYSLRPTVIISIT
jgi:hypothetical protein